VAAFVSLDDGGTNADAAEAEAQNATATSMFVMAQLYQARDSSADEDVSGSARHCYRSSDLLFLAEREWLPA